MYKNAKGLYLKCQREKTGEKNDWEGRPQQRSKKERKGVKILSIIGGALPIS